MFIGNSKAGIEIIAVANNTVFIHSNQQQMVALKVIAADGKEILLQKLNLLQGNNSFRLHMKDNARGIHNLVLYSEQGEFLVKRFLH